MIDLDAIVFAIGAAVLGYVVYVLRRERRRRNR